MSNEGRNFCQILFPSVPLLAPLLGGAGVGSASEPSALEPYFLIPRSGTS
ncbi:MAG: hypothetical protein F6K14_03560 [Symploca sp. SIO2C1]|nr:hypothetical protein [Symploca sp. SIO2C1]